MLSRLSFYYFREHNSAQLLFKSLGLDNKFIKYDDLKLSYYDDHIIGVTGPNIDYEIDFREEEYVITAYYKDYSYIRHYEYDNYLFRKITRFDIGNENDLVLDELSTEDLSFRRMLITSRDDIELENEVFEREISSNSQANIKEEFKKEIKDKDFDYHAVKRINLDDNYYCYCKDTYINPLEQNFVKCDVEAACCVNKPEVKFVGRFDDPNDAMHSCVVADYPALCLTGKYYFYDNKKLCRNEFFVTFILLEGILTVSVIEINYNGKIIKDDFDVVANDYDSIKSDDIPTIIAIIKERGCVDKYISYLEKELLKIKDSLAINEGIKEDNLDFFSSKMKFFDRYEMLCYDIYNNLDKYLSHIDIVKENETSKKRTL